MLSLRAAFGLLLATMVSTGAAVAAAGCSSSDTNTVGATTDGGIDAAKKADSGSGKPESPAGDSDAAPDVDCITQCQNAHPTAVDKDKAIDTCWEAHCNAPCSDGSPVVVGDAGADDGGTDGGTADGGVLACISDVDTEYPSCTECTKIYCCAAWDGCFQDKECAALDDCYAQCPSP